MYYYLQLLIVLCVAIYFKGYHSEELTDEEFLEEERKAISYHFSMLNDHGRNKAFHDALREVITPNSRVLDVGAGSSLLSMMASKLGAESVLAVEKNSVMAEAAREILDLNGFTDNEIKLFTGQSYDVEVGSYELPEPANVYVSETLDSWVISEGIVVALHDAKTRGLITEDAIVIPNKATVFCQLVETTYSLGPIPGIVEGFNLEPIRHLRKDEDFFVVELTHQIVRKNLSDVIPVFEFKFQDLDLETGLFNYTLLDIPITQSGNFHAIAFWFDCALNAAETIRLINSPLGGTHWMQMVTFMPKDEAVVEGQNYKVQIAHTGEKYIFSSAQHERRSVHIVSSCTSDVEIFLSPSDKEDSPNVMDDDFVTILPGTTSEFERNHNIYHGNIGDTFKAFVPSSAEYQRHLNDGIYFVHQEFAIPADPKDGNIVLHEFVIQCEDYTGVYDSL